MLSDDHLLQIIGFKKNEEYEKNHLEYLKQKKLKKQNKIQILKVKESKIKENGINLKELEILEILEKALFDLSKNRKEFEEIFELEKTIKIKNDNYDARMSEINRLKNNNSKQWEMIVNFFKIVATKIYKQYIKKKVFSKARNNQNKKKNNSIRFEKSNGNFKKRVSIFIN